jgi:hypothetical protein
MTPHRDVILHRLPRAVAAVVAAGKILKRQKKRFDAIIAPDPTWAGWLRRLGWIHRARVLPAQDHEAIATLWHPRTSS